MAEMPAIWNRMLCFFAIFFSFVRYYRLTFAVVLRDRLFSALIPQEMACEKEI